MVLYEFGGINDVTALYLTKSISVQSALLSLFYCAKIIYFTQYKFAICSFWESTPGRVSLKSRNVGQYKHSQDMSYD